MNRRVTYAIANLRMGGQVSSLTSLAASMTCRGFDVAFALPPGVTTDKASLTAFTQRPAIERGRAMVAMLRNLPASGDDVVHLMLPTPSFAPLALLAPTPTRAMVLQYEGPPTAVDAEHLRLFVDDPALMAPRMVLNHRLAGAVARFIDATHLATTPGIARALRRTGCRHVVEIPNIAAFSPADHGANEGAFVRDEGTITIAYVGHCHAVKGIDDLVEAFAIAQPQRPALRLMLALSGDGDRHRIERAVERLPSAVRAAILLVGLVPVASVLATIDALVLPYRSMATTTLYPSLLLEADLAGCPLVVSATNEIRAISNLDCPTLHLVKPRSPAALAETLMRLPPRTSTSTSTSTTTTRALRLPDASACADALAATYTTILRGVRS